MACTYTLTSTSMKGGRRDSWGNAGYPSYYYYGTDGSTCLVGKHSSSTERYYATYIKFDSTILNSLRSKTITSVKLTIVVKSGTILPSTSTSHLIGYKYTSSEGSTSASDAWQRGNVDSTATTSSTTANIAGYVRSTSSSSLTASNTTLTITLTNTLPKYGYVIGCENNGLTSYITLANSATLTVVTNEPIVYVVNNGSLDKYVLNVVSSGSLVMYKPTIVSNGSLVPYS